MERSRRRNRFLALAGVLSRVAVAGAAKRLALLWSVVLVFASVVFQRPYGLKPEDATRDALAVPVLGLMMLAGWLLMAAPVAFAVLDQRRVAVLRALPVPLWWFWSVRALHLMIVELPWAFLWERGIDWRAGVLAAAVAAAGHALLVAGWRALAAWRPAWPWRRGRRSGVPRQPTPALAVASALATARLNRGSMGRAALVMFFGTVIAALAAVNNHVVAPGKLAALAAAVACTPVILVTSALAGQLAATERGQAWLLDCCGVAGGKRVVAAALVGAVWGAVCGLVLALVVAVVAASTAGVALRTVVAGVFAGAALGATVTERVRAAAEMPGWSMVALAIGATTAIGLAGEAAVLAGAAAAAVHLAVRARRPAPLPAGTP
jgi:hypothetical protein